MIGEEGIAAAGQAGQFDSTKFSAIRKALNQSFSQGENRDMNPQERHDFAVAHNLLIAQDPTSKPGPKKFATKWLKDNAKLDAQGKSIAPITNQNGAGGVATMINTDAASTQAGNQGAPAQVSIDNSSINNVGGGGGSETATARWSPEQYNPKKDIAVYDIYRM
jgi:hypothetical protein